MSTAGTGHNHALQLAGGTEGVVVRAASEFERLAIARSRHMDVQENCVSV